MATRKQGWLIALLPLLLLAALISIFVATDGAGLQVTPAAPVEQLDFERVVLQDQAILADVRNSSPQPVTIAVVYVNDAVIAADAHPSNTIPRLGRTTIRIPYHWVQAEPLHITLLSAAGIRSEHLIDVATATPTPGLDTFLRFLLIGLYVGVIPVGLGMLWYPALRRLGRKGLQFILALTVGLLAFLAVDALDEAFELAADVPGIFQGKTLVIAFTALSLLALLAAGQRPASGRAATDPAARRLRVAWLIALGIGLHNLGEGLAIGAAYAVGSATLGTFLVIGFTLHNVTEGIGIVAPLTRARPPLSQFVKLAALAGVPAILGTWIGGFFTSPVISTICFAVGAGAILQVIYEVGKLIWEQSSADEGSALSWLNAGGLTAGLAAMWLTALLVK